MKEHDFRLGSEQIAPGREREKKENSKGRTEKNLKKRRGDGHNG